MARSTDAKCKKCRREGMKLFLKGERCLTEKCGVERRAYPPGQHGRGRIKQSEYLLQLREKQKAKRYYGVLEKQFANYYDKASRKSGITGENLLGMLETRGSAMRRPIGGPLYLDDLQKCLALTGWQRVEFQGGAGLGRGQGGGAGGAGAGRSTPARARWPTSARSWSASQPAMPVSSRASRS